MKKVIVHPRVKKVIIHPFAFAVFPVLSLYVKNVGKGHLREAIEITVGVLILAALFWLFVNLFVKDKRKSSVIVSVFFVLFFSYGHVISAFSTVLERMHLLDKAGFFVEGTSSLLFWLAIGGVLFLAASYFAVKSASDLRPLTKVLNIVALMLMVMLGVNSVAAGVDMFLLSRARIHATPIHEDEDGASVSEFINSWQKNGSIENSNATAGSSPDIYYIILDMYARADFLAEICQFDNSEFLSFLADKGFYLAGKSRSNYPHTTHSLASTLNFMYLDDVAGQIGKKSKNFWPLTLMIKNNKVFQYLRNHGYTILAFSSGYGFTEARDADIYMEPTGWRPGDFQNVLMGITPLAILRKTQDDFRRELILHIFDHLADATRIDSPAFVFAHIPAPHPPYVFGAKGEPVQSKPEKEYEYDEYIEAYTNQLAFVNKRMQVVIEEILAQSSKPPIIIVQADHGIYANDYDYASRMSILNAYYFPDQNYDALYEDITPVNTFRVILNNYFGTNHELLEDKSYFSDYWGSPYLFVDVTDEVLSGK